MKINDNAYCKKTLKHQDLIYFIKGQTYTIIDMETDNIYVLDELSSSISFRLLTPNEDEYKFKDHFFTEKEIRKQKIEKINDKL